MFGQDPEQIFQTQNHHDELVETTNPDPSLLSTYVEDIETMELLGLMDGGAAGPKLSIENLSFNSLSLKVFGDYIYSDWWRTWYPGT